MTDRDELAAAWEAGYRLGRDRAARDLAHLHNPYTAALDLPGVDVICARCGYDSREPSGRNCPRTHGGDDVS